MKVVEVGVTIVDSLWLLLCADRGSGCRAVPESDMTGDRFSPGAPKDGMLFFATVVLKESSKGRRAARKNVSSASVNLSRHPYHFVARDLLSQDHCVSPIAICYFQSLCLKRSPQCMSCWVLLVVRNKMPLRRMDSVSG